MAEATNADHFQRSWRINVRFCSGLVKGGFHLVSLYCHDAVGLQHAKNPDLLQELAVRLRGLATPWIVAADWQDPPEVLHRTGWLQMTKGTIKHSGTPTCGERCLDYFVVHHSLASSVVATYRIEDAAWSSGAHGQHWPVRLVLAPRVMTTKTRQVAAPSKFAAKLPEGPQPEWFYKHDEDSPGGPSLGTLQESDKAPRRYGYTGRTGRGNADH